MDLNRWPNKNTYIYKYINTILLHISFIISKLSKIQIINIIYAEIIRKTFWKQWYVLYRRICFIISFLHNHFVTKVFQQWKNKDYLLKNNHNNSNIIWMHWMPLNSYRCFVCHFNNNYLVEYPIRQFHTNKI